MYLGIDIGTSSVKTILVDEREAVLATASAALEVSRPQPGFSEQNPEDWWQAVLQTVDAIKAAHPAGLAAVTGIGLSGQQHGATLLDKSGAVLRPCILWNDGRSAQECRELEAQWPELRAVTGNPAMAGFTAPKLLWVKKHEPEIFKRVAMVLLPKAYIRYRLTGEYAEDMSDASGTLWLDVAKRDWTDAGLTATSLTRAQMPRLVEGNAVSGVLHKALAARFGMKKAPVVAGGGGDNAAGAVGLGAIQPGRAFISVGTSGVIFATTARFAPNAESAVHAFCHAVPETWHQMGVTLSAGSCLSWWAKVARASESQLLKPLGGQPARPSPVLFLPYLSGERTPYNDADIRGGFVGLAHETSREMLTQAVLEGVAFAFRDTLAALKQAGTTVESLDIIGGGSRSPFWISILASVLKVPVHRLAKGESGGAFGAARLGRMAATGEAPGVVCQPAKRSGTVMPDAALLQAYDESYGRYRALYPAIKGA